MDDFPGLLARDFGFKPQGKSAPMAPSRNNNLSANSSSSNFGPGSNASEFTKPSSLKSNEVFDYQDRDGLLFNDVFGGPPKYSSTSAVDSSGGNTSSFGYDSIFRDQNAKSLNSKWNSMPVFDKPVYDDDIFEGLPGLKNSSATAAAAASPSVKFDDVFSSTSGSPPKQRSERESSPFDDLLGNLGKKETESRVKPEKDASAFDDLLPGFGRSSSPSGNRSTSESSWSQKSPSNLTKTASSVTEEPFVVLETPMGSSSEGFTDPMEEIGKFSDSESLKVNGLSVSGGLFDDLDPLSSFGKSVPPVSPEVNKSRKDSSPLRSNSTSGTQTHPGKESVDRSSVENSEGYVQNRIAVDGFQGSNETFFDMRSFSTDSNRSAGRATSPPSYMSASPSENSQIDPTPKSEEIFESADDVWLTVSEIPLFTQPTSAPPPLRPPPPRPTRVSKSDIGSANARKKANEHSLSSSNSSQYVHSPKSASAAVRSPVASQIDELEDFAMGGSWNNVSECGDIHSGEDMENSIAAASAAAMKEAMDRAEAKFRHAKEMRERESLKVARSRESVQLDKDERSILNAQERELRERQERLDRERLQREKEEEQRRLEREREEKEREQRRLEKERERAREFEKEREKARQAVERATREARERAAAEARLKAERAAVDKANAAARERAGRAAVQRAQAEARERAAAEAKERAERAAAEARERANAAREKEVRERATTARAAEQAAAEARERAAAEARERAAAEARERATVAAAARANQNQQKNDNDLESFFSMNSRPSSAPRPTTNTSDPLFDAQSKGPELARRTSGGASSHMKKASSTTNIVDDLSSIFGAGSSAGEFQDVEGETEERRRARLERHQRTQERAAKALAEKNQRDLQVQREQAERHRIAETLDIEIKRWATGKEGNIRALLATLQYVLWPECGWQPVSLTDLITAAAVKKVYRKATLCIHPDKVQQKGANLQQKYIAEKVFDLLKEAWNKFNSEELF